MGKPLIPHRDPSDSAEANDAVVRRLIDFDHGVFADTPELEAQMAEDTCLAHDRFCCPVCFDMRPAA